MTNNVRSDAAPDTIVPMLQAKRRKKRGRPVIAAVAGGSGDGKGFLISRIAERLGAEDVTVFPLDEYYIGAARMKAAGVPHFDHPDALDLALAGGHLAGARVGQTLRIPSYDFPTGERAGEQDLEVKPYVLVDGLFALRHPAILAAADVKIFVRSDHDSSMLRRLFRDAGPNGRTRQSSREVLEQYFRTVWPAKKEFIDPTAAQADVIVESCYDPAVEAVRAGPLQVQIKARGSQPDDHVVAKARAVKIAQIGQTDRFMHPKVRAHRGELLRLRLEDGQVSLTYKGPFLPDVPGARHATSSISMPMEIMTQLRDDYDIAATFRKSRTLFQAGGLIISRDHVPGLGSFFEVRSTSVADLPKMEALLGRLCPGQPVITQSYFELWMDRGSTAASARP